MEQTIEGFRLSPQQRHLWRLGAGDPDAPYRAQCVIVVRGRCDLAALRGALADLVARHEILRTSFPRMANVRLPLQAIAETADLALDERALLGRALPEDLDAERRDLLLDQLAEEEWRRPLDPVNGPLLRACLVERSGEERLVVLTLAALGGDGPTLRRMCEQVARAYACRVGTVDGLEGLEDPVQYADVSEWQNDLLQDESTAAGREHWSRHTPAGGPDLRLPVEHPLAGAFEPRLCMAALPPEVAGPLETLAAEWEVGPGDLLLAAWRALLWRLTGISDLAVGVVADGRKYPQLAAALGPLARPLPLAGALAGDLTLRALAMATRQAWEEILLWQEYFSWDATPVGAALVGAVPAGDASAGNAEPFLPLGFELAEPGGPLDAGGAVFELRRERAVVDRFKVHLRCVRRAAGWEAELHYDAGALGRREAERLLEAFQALLASAVRAPHAALAELPAMGPAELHEVLCAFNHTGTDFPRADRLLHELVEEPAERTPDAVAVVCEGSALSYGELDRRANRLARHLRRLGVGPDVRVALAVERSLEMVVALLGVLKAGGCYVPVDPEYPAERVALMLEDARPAVVLTQTAVAGRLPRGRARTLRLDADWPLVARESGARLERAAWPEDLAYVLFTSGSTGRPKGVMIPHRAIVSHMLWMGDRVALSPGDRVVQKTPFSFDPSVWELYAPLQAGACLVMARPGGHRDSAYLAGLMADEGVAVLRVVPTLLRLLLAEPGLARCTALREVYCGGEPLAPELRDLFFSRLAAGLHNVYGPTEATIVSTAWACAPGERGAVPIGLPIANAEVYVLDGGARPAPIGVAGELYLGGVNVGRGYLGRPDLTAERYLPDPFSGRSGDRLYRSGDLARFRADGAVEFLGRVDHQVKLHGQRIELGEIEAALARHPSVQAAVALAREDEPGDRRLVAYWVPAPGGQATVVELRSHLQERLPDFMVPAVFVGIPELPLAPNGKIDRRVLPAPPAAGAGAAQYALPATPEQEVLAAIWGEVLGVERVGLNDNFFALGADSIRALRVVALAKEKGYDLTLAALFQHQTLGELGRELGRLAGGDEALATTPFSLVSPEDLARLPPGLEDAYPMTSMQIGMIYHMQMHPDAPSYHNVNCFLFQMRLSEPLLREAVRRVVARHPVLRTSFDMESYGEPMQLVHREAHLPVELEDLSALAADEQERAIEALVERERRRPFDLSRPPQMRYFVHRVDPETFWFTQVDNHAIIDGWSLTSILREVLTLHNAMLGQRPLPEEPPLTTTFRDFVRLERVALESEACRDYWRAKVEGASAIALPRWPSEVNGKSALRVKVLPVDFPEATGEGLRRLARSAAVPVKSVCLAAHLKALSLISGMDDVLTGLPTHGRPETVDGERVRGLFLNTVPFRLRLRRESWRELAERVFAGDRELMPYRRYPLAAIQRNWHDRPLFEVLFSFVEFHHLWSLLEQGELRVLDKYKAWAAPHYTLMCGFNQHPPLGKLTMRLYYDTAELADRQVEAYARCYRAILNAMADRPDELHTDLDLGVPREEEIALLQGATHVAELEEEFSF